MKKAPATLHEGTRAIDEAMDETKTHSPLLDVARTYRHAPVGLCCLDTELRFVHINEWMAEINGLSIAKHLGRTIGEVLPEVAAGVEQQLRSVLQKGEPILAGRIDAETPAQQGVLRSFQHNYYPVRSNDGTIVGVSCVVQEVTARREAEKQSARMVDELDHRVKNTMATVLALCEQTMAASDTLEDFKEAYTARLQAMSRTHSALSRNNWRGVSIEEVLEIAVEPYAQGDGQRLTTEGEFIVLPAPMTAAAGMVLNELATNAVKYGAFSCPTGKIDVRWLLARDGILELTWTERGGPPSAPPDAPGFGLRLIRGLIEHELDGQVTFDFGREGMQARLRVPLGNRTEAEPALEAAIH